MVCFKGKEFRSRVMAARVADENRAPKNIAKDLKIAGEQSRRVARKAPVDGSRNSGSLGLAEDSTQTVSNRGKGLQNVGEKRETSVKVKSGRKALTEISNLNNNNPKIMKEKLAGANITQGKPTTASNTYRPRISLTKNVVMANGSSKPSKNNGKISAKASGWLNIYVETSTRKMHAESSSCQGQQSNQSVGRPKLVKNQGVKLSRPRLSFAAPKAMDGNSSSGKLVGRRVTSIQTNLKLKRAPTTKHNKPDAEISIFAKACQNKVNSQINSGPGGTESVSSTGCVLPEVNSSGTSCSSDYATAIISKPKGNRRKSYTSSLVARSEIMGESAESAKLMKKDNIDDDTNPLEVVEYVDDIYQYYWTMEIQNPLPADYMARQPDITPRMRGILINWLIEVHLKFQLMQETLFLMIQLLDRVLSAVPIKTDQLQLVGLTSLLLASKYEDYWHPKISELVSLSADCYTRDHMLAMEKFVLKKLTFRLNLPTPYVFMLRFLKAAKSDRRLEHLAFYLIELCLGEYEALKYRPSLLCASALYVARCTLQITPAWTGLLRRYTRYEETQLRASAELILRFHKASKPMKIPYEKYMSEDRCSVAALAPLDMLP